MRLRNLASVFLATAFVASFATAGGQDPNTPEAKARAAMVGKTAPALNVGHWVNTDGKALSLQNLKGKVVVLDFFTYW